MCWTRLAEIPAKWVHDLARAACGLEWLGERSSCVLLWESIIDSIFFKSDLFCRNKQKIMILSNLK